MLTLAASVMGGWTCGGTVGLATNLVRSRRFTDHHLAYLSKKDLALRREPSRRWGQH